jgi:toxin ParE1/3/4
MKRRVRFLPEARYEYDDAVTWYERRRAGLGAQLIGRIREVLRRISANPKMHAKVYNEARKAVVAQFPYIVIYQEEGDEVLIICRVPHIARPEVLAGARLIPSERRNAMIRDVDGISRGASRSSAVRARAL